MSLRNKIESTVPVKVNVYGGVSEIKKALMSLHETYESIENLADDHAVGFFKWVHDRTYKSGGAYYYYGGEICSPEKLLSIYKKEYPEGYGN